MILGVLFLAVIHSAAGFNILTNPVRTFQEKDDLFGQTTVQSKKGALVTSPNSRPPAVLNCTIEGMCSKVEISAPAKKGLRPIVSADNRLTEDIEQHMFCQQARNKVTMNEDFNGNCAILIASRMEGEYINPAALVVEQLGRNITTTNNNNNKNKNNNNNNSEDDEDEDDPGTEIAFVLDGSASLSQSDFEKAKEFISTVMKNVWEKCLNCDFAVLQYGTNIIAELLLKDSISNSSKALQTVSDIKHLEEETMTASAIIHLCEHVFVAENGSREDSKKIMILLSDGEISYRDTFNLPKALDLLKKQNISRYAIGVGNATKTIADMKTIAPDNHFMVGDYKVLDKLLSLLQTSIIKGIEGLKQGAGFTFQLAEAGFSNHMAPDGFLLFGAVGAYDWSGGVILKHREQNTVTFLNGSSRESWFSYLGYSVISAVDSFETSYISGAPRYNLTGGVFVFSAKSHELMSILQGDQVGSYFGSVLCALDTDKDSKTDYLLIGAPHFHRRGEEGKVYVYRLHQGVFLKEDWEWQGLDNYEFARFGSAIATVGDLDGNRYNDVAIGAPLEEDSESGRSGSIYIYNGIPGGIMHEFTQRISAGDFDMKLRHFGQSVSAFSDQKDNQRQKYISVGSQGKVTVLETLPVIAFEPKLILKPNTILIHAQTNTVPTILINLHICFNSKKETIKSGENLTISYIIHLDAGQNQKRLFFKEPETARESNFTLLPDTECLGSPIELHFQGCYDCFSPIEVRLKFNLPSKTTSKPVRILDALDSTDVAEKIEFLKDCNSTCVRNMSLSDSKLSHDKVVIGSNQNVLISFNLTNHEDGTFMTTLFLTYPNILLYNMFIVNSQKPGGSVVCEVQDTSQLKCRLLHPVFRRNDQVKFDIIWQLADKKSQTREAYIIANLTCENGGTQVLDDKKYHFGIKNALRVQLTGEVSPNSLTITDTEETKQLTFTFQLHGKNDHNAALNVSIVITVKADHTDFKISHIKPKDKCNRSTPANTGVKKFEKYLIHCVMTDLKDIVITAEATIKDVQSASEKITAEATVTFDEDLYEALEVKYKEMVQVTIRKLVIEKSMAAIIGGSIGGFLFLALIMFLLIKCGFFKRRHENVVQSNTG
ncbi:integrin alpha-E-like [Osmerus eperlanus]|uniref:integrin alpha-E-like n=1 Tax=Osmerus eperlanus TaxID=29151 RepID=UPI002E0E33CC